MRHQRSRGLGGRWIALLLLTTAGCAAPPAAQAPTAGRPPARAALAVKPGITVLLEDSLQVIAGRRIAIITNHTGIDASGASVVDLLVNDPRVKRAGVTVVRLFSPEHGIRGTEDVTNLPDVRDERSGLMVHSLYRRETVPPPDSLLRDIDALVFDLQDIGTRTWTYVGVMVYGMRAAARAGIPFIVLDRPNPLGGRAEGPILDSTLAFAGDPTAERRGQAYALYPTPLRHGMTNGELARMFAAELPIEVQLTVVRASGWRRGMWWDDAKLPWVVPSPAMTSLASATTYPALVPFEGSNVSVGRGTDRPFQRFGAPWMDARKVADLLNDRAMPGVHFEAERFTPRRPGDGKFADREVPGVRIVVDAREQASMGRVGAAILWALHTAHADSLRVNARTFDLRFGVAAAREAIVAGTDPDEVLDRMLPAIVEFQRRVRPYLLY